MYRKLLRAIAVARCPTCGREEINALMDMGHMFFKQMYNRGESTTKLSIHEFHLYYSECQRASILMFGVSGMDEDSKSFDA